MLWEGLWLWVGQRRSFRAVVERGRGAGWGLQKSPDSWMVQYCKVTFGRLLGHTPKAVSADIPNQTNDLELSWVCMYGNYLWELRQPSIGIVIGHYACPQLVHHPPSFIESLQNNKRNNKPNCSTLLPLLLNLIIGYVYPMSQHYCITNTIQVRHNMMKTWLDKSIIDLPDLSHLSRALCSSSPKKTALWWWFPSSVRLHLVLLKVETQEKHILQTTWAQSQHAKQV